MDEVDISSGKMENTLPNQINKVNQKTTDSEVVQPSETIQATNNQTNVAINPEEVANSLRNQGVSSKKADGIADAFRSTFTVTNGVAKIWGLGSGNTYYIKETGPPNKEGYGLAQGVIRLTVEREGQVTYLVDVIADADGNEPSNGFTVHGVRIDEETKTVYIVATNAPETVTETTTVQVIKKWEDTKSHSADYITAYLTVTDPDGTVRRIREITLSDENDWTYIWTNLPKYDYKAMTEVKYGVEESYESGYYSTVRRITEIEITKTMGGGPVLPKWRNLHFEDSQRMPFHAGQRCGHRLQMGG